MTTVVRFLHENLSPWSIWLGRLHEMGEGKLERRQTLHNGDSKGTKFMQFATLWWFGWTRSVSPRYIAQYSRSNPDKLIEAR